MPHHPDDDARLLRFRKLPRVVRLVYSRPRLFVSIAVGIVAALLLPDWLRPVTRALIGWDVSIVVYLTVGLFDDGALRRRLYPPQRRFAG
ncbi:hypothetical protein BJ123_11516 [Rhodopseudomonas thermotolerans]|uniref:Uncharacterized protein n=2 Tax=Rhodopseudomonas TaxID=1073 RepID=A0A336JQM3_9BRAD|nr:hypothetical protein BJ125_11516 [Rhodopseudomonas pentothenatexigens]REF92806.1 hypothetical protein BJ123_11516 [Rhodopseudomonas thermotolerans]SSW91908.1 hypothetical protein SAMN05892882_11516 [Rhodopseudomonas pentothenatexigens]